MVPEEGESGNVHNRDIRDKTGSIESIPMWVSLLRELLIAGNSRCLIQRLARDAPCDCGFVLVTGQQCVSASLSRLSGLSGPFVRVIATRRPDKTKYADGFRRRRRCGDARPAISRSSRDTPCPNNDARRHRRTRRTAVGITRHACASPRYRGRYFNPRRG